MDLDDEYEDQIYTINADGSMEMDEAEIKYTDKAKQKKKEI